MPVLLWALKWRSGHSYSRQLPILLEKNEESGPLSDSLDRSCISVFAVQVEKGQTISNSRQGPAQPVSEISPLLKAKECNS